MTAHLSLSRAVYGGEFEGEGEFEVETAVLRVLG
jgi:hypothetical protein